MIASCAVVERDGAVCHPGLAAPMLADLDRILARMPDGRAGLRISDDRELGFMLGEGGPVGAVAKTLLGAGVQPVRVVLFDKNDAAGWVLGWHQDRTITVRQRIDVSGFGPWTVKQGIVHVEPPFSGNR